jgi:hypothetical protein
MKHIKSYATSVRGLVEALLATPPLEPCSENGFANSDGRPGFLREPFSKITAEEVDNRPSCMQMLKDLRHPYAQAIQSTMYRLEKR